MKRFLALFVTLAMLVPMTAFGATANPYSFSVQNGKINFIKNGKVTGTFKLYSDNITLKNHGTTGELLVCFYESANEYTGVTLGSQDTVTALGSMSSLTIHDKMDPNIAVTLGSSAKASTVTVDSPANVTIQGTVGKLKVADSAKVGISKNSTVDSATVTDKGARLTAAAGSTVTSATAPVASCLSGSGFQDKEIDESTESSSSKSDSSSSSSESGSRGEKEVDYEVNGFKVGSADYKLSELTDRLNENVIAYDDKGLEIKGTAKFASSASRVKSSGWFRFTYTPKDTKYATFKDEIHITVDESYKDEEEEARALSWDYEEELSSRYTSKKLSDFTSKLKSAIKVYDGDGKTVTGTFRWVESSSTRVRETGDYEFKFTPTNKKYETFTGSVTIYINED